VREASTRFRGSGGRPQRLHGFGVAFATEEVDPAHVFENITQFVDEQLLTFWQRL
jgi:hypothetical protein